MKRKKTSHFYIFGKKPVEEQLMRNPDNVMRVFVSNTMAKYENDFKELKAYAKDHKIPVNPVTKAKIEEYVGDVNDQGVIALLKQADYVDFDKWFDQLDTESNPCVLVLDHIEDTHNFGAILRSAAALGVAGVIVSKDRQAPINGTVYKTSAGALIHVPVVRVSNINQAISKLKEARFWVTAIDMDEHAKKPLSLWNHTFDTATVLVVGSEGKGVSEKVRDNADFIVSIPMEHTIESLNVSVAAAIAMYEWKRQQQ
ncbi:23S rRNA (guanosine(2251)-2'-O)-methyltransferase RlmB [Candidatus Campbellbacteria bacterium]|nr:23S rRNA (guanosine(2251)-2'-O)-methyltransferase RlmB [Candidatus Campbellbacteria bacterium]|tara:strand:- start:7566 stop:8333 length:768 start_codon:yes stop_codon:yes gene_type:complete